MATYQIRYVREKVSESDPAIITTPKSAADYFVNHCFAPEDLWREKSYALFVDSSRRAYGHMLIGVGGLSAAETDIRLVLKGAVDSMASGVVLAHNHPSGNPIPGKTDIEFTKRIKDALRAVGINFLDHIVLGEKTFFSFSEENTQKLP